MATQDNGARELRRTPRLLGSLESRLMDLLWDAGAQLSGQEVCDRLGDQHHYKTVMTVLNRLVKKELLRRELDGRAYRYVPSLDRSSFLRSVADDLVRGYSQAYGEAGLSHLSAALGGVLPQAQQAPAAPVQAPTVLAAEPQRSNATPIAVIAGAVALLEVLRLLIRRGKRAKD